MSEAKFSFTPKVADSLFTVRGDSYEEFLDNLLKVATVPACASLLELLEGKKTISTREAIEMVEETFGTVDITSDKEVNTSVEEKSDKFGNKYVKGSPGVDKCNHGPRIVKYGTSKAGKKYKAQVCLNDSPWGDWKSEKCETVWG